MKQLAQIKEEKGFMMAQAQYYRNEQIKPMIDEKYGEGAVSYTHLGGVGTGKSYLAGCIANALMEKEIPVRMTNFEMCIRDSL